MKHLLRALRLLAPYRGRVALYLVCAVLLAAVAGLPLALANFVLRLLQRHGGVEGQTIGNQYLAAMENWLRGQFSGEFQYLLGICALVLATVLLRSVLEFLVAYQMSWISQRLQVEATVKLMRHLFTLDAAFFDRRRIGDLVSRMLEDTGALRAASKMALDFLQQPPMILCLSAIAVFINWPLFLVGAVGVPVVVGPLLLVTRRIYQHAVKARAKGSDMAQEMLQDLSGMRTVQAYDAAPTEAENFWRLAGRFFRHSMKRNLHKAMQRPIAEVALGLGGVGMLAGGGWMILNHRMSLPDFLVFIASMAGLYTPIKGLISAVGELAEFVPCAERTFELLDIKPDIRDAPGAEPCPPLERELAFENVTLDYGRGPVFRGLNLRVRKGEKVGIVGPTGAGKSSLLSLLLRFYDPVSGCVKLDGRDIRQVTLSSLRRQMALVTQDPFLFHAGIEENIRYGRPEATRAEVEEAAKAAAIHDDIAALPEGYATVVGERGVTLSGGQRQRVAVARAILRNAPILLLDEATSALDSATEQQVQAALDRLAAGRTCLVVAHRLSTVKDADRIVVLREDGSVEAVAPHQELLRASPTYARLWAHQTGAEADAQKPGA